MHIQMNPMLKLTNQGTEMDIVTMRLMVVTTIKIIKVKVNLTVMK